MESCTIKLLLVCCHAIYTQFTCCVTGEVKRGEITEVAVLSRCVSEGRGLIRKIAINCFLCN